MALACWRAENNSAAERAISHLTIGQVIGVTSPGLPGKTHMAGTHLSIRIDLASGERIGPGKIALLEAIRSTGSISAAARSIGMSYRRAWLLVEELNRALREPAVTAETGGPGGGGAMVTPTGERVVGLYRTIESQARAAAGGEFRAIGKLIRHDKNAG